MIVRITTPGPQEMWYHYVTHASCDGHYLILDLAAHPSRVHVWLGKLDTSVLFCATDADVVDALREERGVVHEMDKVRRI